MELVSALPVGPQAETQEEENKEANMATANPSTRELLALEEKFWQAMKDGDVDTMVSLTDFPCTVTGPQGMGTVDEEAFKGMMASPSYTIESFSLGADAATRMLSDDVAVVAYKVHEELTVDGERVSLDAVDTSTWVRRDGAWRCALHTEALVGDPYGRH